VTIYLQLKIVTQCRHTGDNREVIQLQWKKAVKSMVDKAAALDRIPTRLLKLGKNTVISASHHYSRDGITQMT